jgi:Nuclease-related domain
VSLPPSLVQRRSAESVQRRSADSASPRAPASAGRSALAAWQRERRSRRRRLVIASVLALVALLAGTAWAAASLGAIVAPGPTWPLLALGGCAGCFCLVLWPRSDPDRWARGAAGERATASLLQGLAGRRWVVMHDLALPGSRANVDHLVIGPTGVWVVDTKAYRARVTSRWRGVFVGGVPLSTTAVRWETKVVSQVLGVEARPVVAVHARGFARRGRRVNGVKVVPAARLVSRIRRGRRLWPSLRQDRVRELAFLAERRLTRS